jgi:hypothetical protein
MWCLDFACSSEWWDSSRTLVLNTLLPLYLSSDPCILPIFYCEYSEKQDDTTWASTGVNGWKQSYTLGLTTEAGRPEVYKQGHQLHAVTCSAEALDSSEVYHLSAATWPVANWASAFT